MRNYFPSKGCVYRVRANAPGDSVAYYRLDPEIVPPGGATPVLIQSAPVKKSDIVSPVPSLNNIRRLYAFGRDFGTVDITGIILLGSAPRAEGEARINGYFNRYRTSSASVRPILLSRGRSGDVATPFFLIESYFGSFDNEFHTLEFGFRGIIIDQKT